MADSFLTRWNPRSPIERATLPPPAPDAPTERKGFLCFVLDGAEHGVDLDAVKQIAKPPPVTWVPRARPWILGIISIRGAVGTLVDLRMLMGKPPSSFPRTARVLIVDFRDEPVGLLVDAVTQVRRMGADSLEAPPALEETGKAEHVRFLARPEDGSLVAIIDLEALLAEKLA